MQLVPTIYTGGIVTDALVNGILQNHVTNNVRGGHRVKGGDINDDGNGGGGGGEEMDIDWDALVTVAEGITIGGVIAVVLNIIFFVWLIHAARHTWKLKGNDAIWITLITIHFGPIIGLICGYVFGHKKK
jgi:hypothetical protein